MKQYLDLAKKIIENGMPRGDRTGTGTLSIFGEKMEFNLLEGFPLVTTKRMGIKDIAKELIWFLNGDTKIEGLQGSKIWDSWQVDGETNAPYGWMWRNWDGIDQIKYLVDGIKNRPQSRRHFVSAWNPKLMPNEAISPHENIKDGKFCLPPCHVSFQCYVSSDERFLDLMFYQRSADVALGVPYNIASYSILLHALANECGLRARKLTHIIGDAHIYNNHIDSMKEQIRRKPFDAPTFELSGNLTFSLEDLNLTNYKHHDAIKYSISV